MQEIIQKTKGVSQREKRRLEIRAVGVFVNEPPGRVCEAMKVAGLDLAQLHGKETVEMVRELGTRAYKSLQPRDEQGAQALIEQYRSGVNGNCPAFIVDSPPQKLPGGNGVVANWRLAARIAREFPILLAGGLNVDNVADAVAQVRPWGVDVSSGVERAPGFKDHEKVREFIRRVKGEG